MSYPCDDFRLNAYYYPDPDQNEWDEWIQTQIRNGLDETSSSIRPCHKTGLELVSLATAFVVPFVMPTIVQTATDYTKKAAVNALTHSIHQLLQPSQGTEAGNYNASIISSMIAIPTRLFFSSDVLGKGGGSSWFSSMMSSTGFLSRGESDNRKKIQLPSTTTTSANELDRFIHQAQNFANNQQKNMGRGEGFESIHLNHFSGPSTQAVLLGVGAVSTLLFEFIGMRVMQGETQRNEVLSSLRTKKSMARGSTGGNNDNNQPLLGGGEGLIGVCKRILHQQYISNTKYYKTPGVGGGSNHSLIGNLSPQEMNPIRIVYNILVGINYILFHGSGYESIDPTAEIVHWSSILFYWEVLARLVQLYGWGPVSLATKLLFSDLWSEQQTSSISRGKK